MRYTPRREATEPRSGECLQSTCSAFRTREFEKSFLDFSKWGLFGHVDFNFCKSEHRIRDTEHCKENSGPWSGDVLVSGGWLPISLGGSVMFC